MDIFGYISKLQTNHYANRNDDDFADRLNYRYTIGILIGFAVIASNRQFSERVIKCWVPAFFTPNFEAYANQVCWISNTYYVNSNSNVPKSEEIKKSTEIKYYQWIPFILLIQAIFLYIPRIMWRVLTARAGLDMRDLIEAAHSYKSVEKYQNKEKIMEYIVHNIDQYASNPRRSKHRDSIFHKFKYFGESLFCGSGIYLGNYLVTTYFFTRIAYLINSIAQFYLMNEFLGKQFHQLGIDLLRYLTNTYNIETSNDSVYFPKVVMCDFKIREFGHPNFSHKYTIQCVLPINLYNQQIFTLLWFWFLFLIFANLWALFKWINRMLPGVRRHYINKRLNMLKHFKKLNETTSVIMRKGFLHRKKSVSDESRRQKRKFINDYLKFDGVFILQMISMLTSELVGTEILHELWNKRAVYNDKIDSQLFQQQDSRNFDSDNPNNAQPIEKKAYNQSIRSWPEVRNEAKSATNLQQSVSTPLKRDISSLFKKVAKQVSVLDTLSVNRTKQMRINNRIQNLRNNEVYEIQSQKDSTTRITSTPSMNRLNSQSIDSQTDSIKSKHKRVAFASTVQRLNEDEKDLDIQGPLDNIDDVFKDINLDLSTITQTNSIIERKNSF